ncbi:MAG: DUF4345 domain-containing protein [Rhizomicrobium sp.]
MTTALRILLALLGVSSVLIALSILLLGAGITAHGAEAAYNALVGGHYPLTGAWPATMDSELRFYAPFWGVYGLLLLDAARDLPKRLDRVPLLAGVFFAGGIGRALSLATVGAPHPAFTLLMAIELILPAVFIVLWHALTRQSQPVKQ